MDPRLLPLTDHGPLAACRLELLRPHEIADRLRARPAVYLPVGTLEYHAEHLPVGLDALNAEAVCLRAAASGGGLVFPTLYFGTGGDHARYPWSVIAPSGAEISRLLSVALGRLDELGVHLAVILTGHFAAEQIAVVEGVAGEWNASGRGMRALGLSLDRAEGMAIEPDHAGRFETTLMHAHRPDRVDMLRVPPPREGEAGEDPWGPRRHVPGHSLWGVVGPDPRDFRPDESGPLLAAAVDWLLGQTRLALGGGEEDAEGSSGSASA